jgi:hypothetical protein
LGGWRRDDRDLGVVPGKLPLQIGNHLHLDNQERPALIHAGYPKQQRAMAPAVQKKRNDRELRRLSAAGGTYRAGGGRAECPLGASGRGENASDSQQRVLRPKPPPPVARCNQRPLGGSGGGGKGVPHRDLNTAVSGYNLSRATTPYWQPSPIRYGPCRLMPTIRHRGAWLPVVGEAEWRNGRSGARAEEKERQDRDAEPIR